MKRFEYKYYERHMSLSRGTQILDLADESLIQVGDYSDYGPKLVQLFNEMGQEGWELSGFVMRDKNIFEYIFKREII